MYVHPPPLPFPAGRRLSIKSIKQNQPGLHCKSRSLDITFPHANNADDTGRVKILILPICRPIRGSVQIGLGWLYGHYYIKVRKVALVTSSKSSGKTAR